VKTQYQFINFIEIEKKPKTSVWSCRNTHHGEELGRILYYPAWRQYVYEPSCPATYSAGCLADIGDFIKQLEAERKAGKNG
jgi:hypothetical protein